MCHTLFFFLLFEAESSFVVEYSCKLELFCHQSCSVLWETIAVGLQRLQWKCLVPVLVLHKIELQWKRLTSCKGSFWNSLLVTSGCLLYFISQKYSTKEQYHFRQLLWTCGARLAAQTLYWLLNRWTSCPHAYFVYGDISKTVGKLQQSSFLVVLWMSCNTAIIMGFFWVCI